MTSITNPAVTDMSDTNVTLGGGTIAVTSPNGGEASAIGSIRNITWTSSGIAGNVKVELSRSGGTSWTPIVASTANDGVLNRTVTGPPTTQARVRVSGVADPTVIDSSNASATIQ